MLSWTRQSASHAVSIAFAVSIAAVQPLLLGSASQTPKTTGSASGSQVPCDEINVKARALVDSGKTEEARTFLIAAIEACSGAESRAKKGGRLAAALLRLGMMFLAGALLMVVNIWKTIAAGGVREPAGRCLLRRSEDTHVALVETRNLREELDRPGDRRADLTGLASAAWSRSRRCST